MRSVTTPTPAVTNALMILPTAFHARNGPRRKIRRSGVQFGSRVLIPGHPREAPRPALAAGSERQPVRGRRSNASMPKTPAGRRHPTLGATATTRSIARPRMQTCRPAARPASAADADGDAGSEGVTTTLPFALPTSAPALATRAQTGPLRARRLSNRRQAPERPHRPAS